MMPPAEAPAITLHGQLPDPSEQGGFLPVTVGRVETGFDVLYGSIDDEDAPRFAEGLARGQHATTHAVTRRRTR